MVLFETVSVVHVLVWTFILFAWTNRQAAFWNLYYVVPAVYVLHMLPVHLLTEAKKNMRPDSWERDDKAVQGFFVFPKVYDRLVSALDGCTFNPLSPQGMLVLGAITSAWALR